MNENTAPNPNPAPSTSDVKNSTPMGNMSKNKMLFVLVGLFALLLVGLSLMSLSNLSKRSVEESVDQETTLPTALQTGREDFIGTFTSREAPMIEAYVDASYDVVALVFPRTLNLMEDSTAVLATSQGEDTIQEYGNWIYDETTESIKIEFTNLDGEPMDRTKILMMALSEDRRSLIGIGYSKDDFADDILEFDRQ